MVFGIRRFLGVRVVIALFHCTRISKIYMKTPNFLDFIVSEISAFIRTDRQTDKRTDGQTDKSRIPFYSTSNAYKK